MATIIKDAIQVRPVSIKHKHKKNKKHQPLVERIQDVQQAHEELHVVMSAQGLEHYEMVKPLREEKHSIRNNLIEAKLEKINFHTYETHETTDLLEDLSDGSDEDMDDAFANFIG